MIILAFLVGMFIAGYVGLQNSRIQTLLTSELTKQLSGRINSNVSIGKVYFTFFNKLILEDVLLEDQKNDTLFYVKTIKADIDSLSLKRRKLALGSVSFQDSEINIGKDSTKNFNFSFIIDSLRNPDRNPKKWEINTQFFNFNNAFIAYNDKRQKNEKSFSINDLNFEVSDFLIDKDSLNFNIDNFILNDGKRLQIDKLDARFTSSKNYYELAGLNIKTLNSAINNSNLLIEFPDSVNNTLNTMNLSFTFSNSSISFYELAGLIPGVKGMDLKVDISGNIYGKINDLKGKNLVLKTGQNTQALFDLYVNDITSPENMYLFLDLKNAQTTFNDLSNIKLPTTADKQFLVFPKSFYEAGLLKYKGNFTGFLTDFVAYGTLTSNMGILTTDVSVVPESAGQISYKGQVATKNFRFGELFQNDNFGEITFDGSVDGNFDRNTQSILGEFKGEIARFDFKNYNYKNIRLDGSISNKEFDGILNISDPNLDFDFAGKVNLNPEIPVFDFYLNLRKALPGKLNLSNNFPASELSFFMLANFTGNEIDNLDGSIKVQNGNYLNRNGKLSLEGLELKSVTGEEMNKLTFTSDFINFDVTGKYHFKSFVNAFKKSFNKYLPSIEYDKIARAENNKFEYNIEAKNLDSLTAVFTPGYKFETPFLLYGNLDSEQSIFKLEGSIPGFSTKNIRIKDIFIGNGPAEELYASKFRVGEIMLKNGMTLYNMTVESKLSDNTIQNQITWTNYHRLTYSGRIITKAVFSDNDSTNHPHIAIEGFPTKIYIADSLWQIAPFSATIDSSSFNISDFRFYNDNQAITINGEISEKPSSKLTVNFENISLWYLDEYMDKDFSLGGIMEGSAGIADFYNERFIFSDLTIEDFVFKDQIIGKVSLVNEWDYFNAIVDSNIKIEKNERESLNAHGIFNPATNELMYNADIDQLSLVVLETLIRKNFSNILGTASGRLILHGTPDKILLDGSLLGEDATLTIDYTQVKYNFTDTVYFKGDTIHFKKINLKDERGNTGIFDGTIVHNNFKDMIYNLSVTSPKILAFNTTPRINEQFFGQIVANGRLDITGENKQVYLNGFGTTLNGTNVNISMDYDGDVEQFDFIQFVSYEEKNAQEFTFPKQVNSDFKLNLTVHATPEAKIQVIYSSQIGDVIKAQGEGYLNFELDKEGNITLSGDYTVEKGDYLFTLQNVINKRFNIERGGLITWSGDPYNAIIDINAVYQLKASVYELLNYLSDDLSPNQRIPVECKIMLTENLSNPEIDFEISYPSADAFIASQLQQYTNTQEELNKQILSLLVLGRFYIPEYMRGQFEAQNPNVIGTTASELFSNQLSNWLSQINDNVDIGFNYRPGNQITDDEIELALSTQIFNDRVTINGNIGNNVNPYTGNNSQLVGDFEVNVDLIRSGKIQLKAYNRSNNNIFYETSPYTQGVGFSFTEEYNTINDLFKKFTSVFRKKD